jgi:hypothetical protein
VFHFGGVFEIVFDIGDVFAIAYLLVMSLNHVSKLMIMNNCFAIW